MKTIEGCLASQGVRVQRARLRSSLKRADPDGQRLRSLNPIRRRVYSVRSPLSLWHMDGNHNLSVTLPFCSFFETNEEVI